MTQMHENDFELNDVDRQLVEMAIEEDVSRPAKDLTTQTLLKNQGENPGQARIFSKEKTDIILCGEKIVTEVFRKLDAQAEILSHVQDGQGLKPGENAYEVKAKVKALLSGERIALNFLRRLSAIATLTKKYTEKVKGTNLKILDTRKTTPGLRHMEKYAVSCGGGVNHRFGLYDAVMVKNNHVDFLGGMKEVLSTLPQDILKTCNVIVEVRSQKELADVLNLGKDKVSRILLDNMNPGELKDCVAQINNVFETEASGNINLENILEIAATGVDFASIGQITFGAGNVDLSMHIEVK